MKAMIKLSSIFVLCIMAVSCATAPRAIPEKYNLDNYLEAVDQISMYKVSDCENVDNQSIILEADSKDYYLLVLRRPIASESSHLPIGIENTASKDFAHSAQEIADRIRNNTSVPGPNTKSFTQAPSNITKILSGHDRVVVGGETGEDRYVIDKIYKLKGKEQAEEIKKRLRRIRRSGLFI